MVQSLHLCSLTEMPERKKDNWRLVDLSAPHVYDGYAAGKNGPLALESSHVAQKLLLTCKKGLMYCDML